MRDDTAPVGSPWVVFGLTSVAVFLVSLDATVVIAAFPALREAFSELGGQVVAIVTPGNERSVALLAKLGLVRSRLVKLSEDADECLLLEQA